MNNRIVKLFLIIPALVIGLYMTGCEQIADLPSVTEFGQLRIINFNSTCGVNKTYDVYIYRTSSGYDSIPKVIGLTYGIATPYITNLVAKAGAGESYSIIVRASGSKVGDLTPANTTVSITPGAKLTFLILPNDDAGRPQFRIINDNDNRENDKNKAYFRFINTMPADNTDGGPVTVMVGDPYHGSTFGSGSVNYGDITNYIGFPTAPDTTLAFYIMSQNGKILGRIAGVSLEGGTYKTMTWGGNCPPYKTSGEVTDGEVKDDSLRVRIFDDNNVGNDVTFPVPKNMMFNYVNALTPPNFPSAKIPSFDQIGVVINNDTRYTFSAMNTFSVGPNPVRVDADGVMDVIPISLPLTEAVNVKGFIYNSSTPDIRGKMLFDFRAGRRSDIISDRMTSFVVHDSAREVALDSGKYQFVIGLPDPIANKARIIVANALTPPARDGAIIPLSALNCKFYVNDVQIAKSGNWSPRIYDTTTIVDPGRVKIKGELNRTPTEAFETSFNVEAGYVYEVLFVGQRKHSDSKYQPRFMVIRTNPRWP